MAVGLADELGCFVESARRLGIDSSNIRRWKQQEAAISGAPKTKCITKSRVGAKFPPIDERVCTFIDEKRNNGLSVSRSLIRLEHRCRRDP